MVERSRRGKRKRDRGVNHQRCWLWGRNLVRETLAAGRWPVRELYLADDLAPPLLDEAQTRARELSVPVRVVSRARLVSLAQTSEHQGYLARMGPFPYAAVDGTLAASQDNPCFLILDGIQDPHNFGAILRSAAALGVSGVFVAAEGQAAVSSHVARSSAGAVNRVPLCHAPDLAELARTLRARSVRVIGGSERGDRLVTEIDLTGPASLVIGNEGRGIGPELLAQCDATVRIPLVPGAGSLNAAAAAAILLYEASRQRVGRAV